MSHWWALVPLAVLVIGIYLGVRNPKGEGRWYLSDRQIVDRIADECHLRSNDLHSSRANERAVRAISWVAWEYATERRRPRFRWWPW